ARLAGEDSEDSEPAQYADLSEWQNELLESEETEFGRGHWQGRDVNGFINPKLPSEKQIADRIGFGPRYSTGGIPADLASHLRALALQFESSLPECLLACWELLLWRLAGQPEVVVGVEFNGRRFRELDNVLGPFARYLPVRHRFERGSTFRDVLKQMMSAVRQAHKAQEYFSWEQFAPATDGATSCFYFPFSFDFRHCPVKFNAGEVLFSLCKQIAYIDQCSLRLSCVDGGDWLAAEFHYDPRLFPAEDVSRLQGQFIKLLDSAAAQPDLEAGRLEILPDDQ